MATANNQIALTNTFQSSLSKIPPFLQKLYKIVSDPATDQVIAWSEDGNSFYIHDQATLEAEVLPRWFKTNKTAAFVRQLNKYGFRKVTHLQQGVLKRESEMESSQYVHPDFHRGREDQLAMINEGKKQIHVKEPLLVDSITTEASTSGAGVPALRQTLDVNAVVSDIRRNQARITQELTELKQTDRALWDEAHRSLQRYQQQQNTINLIVQFLGNLLGQMGTKDPTHHDSHPHVPVPVQQQRLMIEDKRRDATTNHDDQENHEADGHNTNARIMEVTDEDEDQLFTMDDEPTVETPGSLAPPPSIQSQAPSPSSFDLTGDAPDSQLMKLTDIHNPPTLSPNFSAQDWSNILSSFGPLANDASFSDFLSTLPTADGGNIAPPEDLHSHISEIEKSVDTMNNDIESLTNLLTLPPNAPLDDMSAYINFDTVDNEQPQPQAPPTPTQQTQPPPTQVIFAPSASPPQINNVPAPPVTRGQKRKSDVIAQPDVTGSTPLFAVNASAPEPPTTRRKNK